MEAAPNWGTSWGTDGGLLAGIRKLTAIQVKNAKPGQKLKDGGGLRFIGAQGGGKWVFRYSLNGKCREMGFGSLPEVSLSDARKARERWSAVVREGKDTFAFTFPERPLAVISSLTALVTARKLAGVGDVSPSVSPQPSGAALIFSGTCTNLSWSALPSNAGVISDSKVPLGGTDRPALTFPVRS